MSRKETNKLLCTTNTSKSLNKRRVTRQQTTQTKISVSHDIPLGSTHITTKVSKPIISYIGDRTELIKKPESTPIKLTKLTSNEICTVRGDDQNRNISSFTPAKKTSVIHFIRQVIFDNNLRKIVILKRLIK